MQTAMLMAEQTPDQPTQFGCRALPLFRALAEFGLAKPAREDDHNHFVLIRRVIHHCQLKLMVRLQPSPGR